MATIAENIDKLFWSKVDVRKIDECWNYKKGRTGDGYGAFHINRRVVLAHRFAYESHYKCKITKNKLILHHCDNPPCCNPQHLYEGTQQENIRDVYLRNRGRMNPDKIAFSLAKFSAKEILLIRSLKILISIHPIRYRHSLKSVAIRFKVHSNTIGRIWKLDKYPCKEGYYI